MDIIPLGLGFAVELRGVKIAEMLLTQSGHSHRGSDRWSVAALPGLAGALSTAAHAGGKSLSIKAFG
jgi:hypothetical protein